MKYSEMMTAEIETLRENYATCRNLAFNNANMAQSTRPGSRTRSKLANSMGFLMRQIDMMESVARKRGLSLVAR